MSFLDQFSEFFNRTVMIQRQGQSKNSIGEVINSWSTVYSAVACIIAPNTKDVYNEDTYSEGHQYGVQATFKMRVDGAVKVEKDDKIIDNTGNAYRVKYVRPAMGFGEDDHMVVYMDNYK